MAVEARRAHQDVATPFLRHEGGAHVLVQGRRHYAPVGAPGRHRPRHVRQHQGRRGHHQQAGVLRDRHGVRLDVLHRRRRQAEGGLDQHGGEGHREALARPDDEGHPGLRHRGRQQQHHVAVVAANAAFVIACVRGLLVPARQDSSATRHSRSTAR